MRFRALGTGPANAWAPAEPPAEPPAPRAPGTVGHAVVAERDQDGVPTRLGLPGPVTGRQVPLYMAGPAGPEWAAAVNASGAIGWDFRDGAAPRPKELARIRPGSQIVAALDSTGRILSLMAVPKK